MSGSYPLREALRIAVNAQIRPGSGTGGVETVLRTLAALSRLEDGPEEYVFIGPWDEPDWLRPLLSERARIVRGPKTTGVKSNPNRIEPLKRALGPLRPVIAQQAQRFLPRADSTALALPVSDGFYESLNCDVLHFPYQHYVQSALPSIYNPHDLQHLHLPQFFTQAEILRRESIYPAACRAAQTVVAASQFVKQDIVRHYRIPAQNVQVIPWALPPAHTPARRADESLRTIRKRYGLFDQPFMLYPAMTWEHKNHLRLLEALAQLRDEAGLKLYLLCTGHKNNFWPLIERRVKELALQRQVKFLGLIAPEELSALYRAAQFVIIPTLFEAVSAPLAEAWQHDVPVACSSVTSLPEQARDAALLFDPHSVAAIAAALVRMATDDGLRAALRRRGHERLQDFSLARTAKAYRAVYRRVAGRVLSEEDRWLLTWDWMQESDAAIYA